MISVRILRAFDTLFARVYHNLTVLNACPLPRHGPAILVSNHIGSVDPIFLQSTFHHRLITWMMAREYMDVKGLSWFFKTIGIIPVERSGRDTTPLRAAIRALENGRVLGVFPEGRIAPTRQLLPFQTGVALMAIRTGAPVYPVYIDGTQRGRDMVQACLLRNQAVVNFGPAVEFDRSSTHKVNLEAATAAIVAAITSLAKQQEIALCRTKLRYCG